MRKIFLIFASWTVTLLICAAQPTPPKNCIFKPTFITGHESFTAGTAFVCVTPDGQAEVLLTAHHLLGSAGGFPAELEWDKINDFVRLTVGLSMDDPSIHIVSSSALRIPGAHALSKEGLANDIAAFKLDQDSTRAHLKLAITAPKSGDKLWLYGRQRGSDNLELMPCRARASTELELDYEFTSNDIKLPGTSGAPVLNDKGQVVAINIGGVEHEGKLVGYGNPLASIVAHLNEVGKK